MGCCNSLNLSLFSFVEVYGTIKTLRNAVCRRIWQTKETKANEPNERPLVCFFTSSCCCIHFRGLCVPCPLTPCSGVGEYNHNRFPRIESPIVASMEVIADAVGASVLEVKYVLTCFGVFPLAYFHKQISDVTTKHIYSLVCGLVLSFFMYVLK